MSSKKNKIFRATWFVAIIAVVLICALVLSACNNGQLDPSKIPDNGNGTVDNGNQAGNNGETAQTGDDANKQNNGENTNSGEQGGEQGGNSGEQGGEQGGNSGEQGGEQGGNSGEQGGEQGGNSGEQGGEQGGNSGEQGGEQGGETEVNLNVAFDQNFVVNAGNKDSIADIASALSVEVVAADGTTRQVQFTVKSTAVSEDGLYLEVVVEAEGVEKTIQLPYVAEEEPEIRADLKPIYDLIAAEGDKSFVLKLSGRALANAEAEPKAITLKAICNVLEEEGVQFALCSEGDSTKVLVMYKDGELIIGDAKVDVSMLVARIAAMLQGGEEELVLEAGDDEIEVGEGIEGGVDFAFDEELGDGLFEGFLAISELLNKLDGVLANPFMMASMSAYDVTLNKADGIYTCEATSKTLLSLLKSFASSDEEEEGGFDYMAIIDLLDARLDGAITAGDIKVHVTLEIKADGVEVTAYLSNAKTGASIGLAAELTVADHATELPEADNAEAKDVEFTWTFALPENDFSVMLDAYLHTSDMFAAEDKDILTAEIKYNGEVSLVRFVLNNGYVYLDVSGLVELLAVEEVEEPQYVAFYQAFELDGEPATILDLLFDAIANGFGGNYEEDPYPYPIDKTIEGDDQGDYDKEFVDYDVRIVSGDELIVAIGTTEAEFRKLIEVFSIDEYGNETIIEDYVIEEYDASEAGETNVKLVLSEESAIGLSFIVYNPELMKRTGIDGYADNAAKGATIDDVKESLYVYYIYSDGTSEWTEACSEYVVIMDGEEVAADFAFVMGGDYDFTVQSGDFTCEVTLHVYDPENLIPVDLECFAGITLEKGATEEDVREMITVTIVYDDGSREDVDDYTIEGFEVGATDFFVYYGDLKQVVTVDYDNDEPVPVYNGDEDEKEDEDGGILATLMKVLPYLRFVDTSADDMLSMIMGSIENVKGILEENGELFEQVFSSEEIPDGVRAFTVALNNAEDVDLVAILNLFVGIPSEDGFVDIDENLLLGYLAEMSDNEYAPDIKAIFRNVVGVELEDVLSDLYFTFIVDTNEGLRVTFSLGNGADDEDLVEYVSTSFGVRLVSAEEVEHVVLTEDEIANAQPFENIKMTAFGIFAGLMNKIMSVEQDDALVYVGVDIAEKDNDNYELLAEYVCAQRITLYQDGTFECISDKTFMGTDPIYLGEMEQISKGTYEFTADGVTFSITGYSCNGEEQVYDEPFVQECTIEDNTIIILSNSPFGEFTAVFAMLDLETLK